MSWRSLQLIISCTSLIKRRSVSTLSFTENKAEAQPNPLFDKSSAHLRTVKMYNELIKNPLHQCVHSY